MAPTSAVSVYPVMFPETQVVLVFEEVPAVTLVAVSTDTLKDGCP